MEDLNGLQMLALQNNVDAQYELGMCYYEGKGVGRNYEMAAKWLSMAAAKNHPDAQYFLAWLYSMGYGVEKDLVKSFELYLAAAQQNNANAQYALGSCYGKGVGVKQNYREALEWSEKALKNGLRIAAYAVGVYKAQLEKLMKNGLAVAEDPVPVPERRKSLLGLAVAVDSAPVPEKRKSLPTLKLCTISCTDFRLSHGNLSIRLGVAFDGEKFDQNYDYRTYDQYQGWYEYFRRCDLKIEGLDCFCANGKVFPIPFNIRDLVYDYVKEHDTLYINTNPFLELVYANLYPLKRRFFGFESFGPILRIGHRNFLYGYDRIVREVLMGYSPDLLSLGFEHDEGEGYYFRPVKRDRVRWAYYVDRTFAVYKGYTVLVGTVEAKTGKISIRFVDEADARAAGVYPNCDLTGKNGAYCQTMVSLDQLTEIYEVRKPFAGFPFSGPEKVYHKRDNIWQPWHDLGTVLGDDEWI